MDLDLSAFITPVSWLIVEILSIVLMFFVISDAIRNYSGNKRIMRIGEFFAFMLYAGLYENVGVGAHIYYYSLSRFMMFGKVPVSILIFEAAVFYGMMRLAERTTMPDWTKPFLVGFGGLLSDLTMDPSSVFDLHNIGGVMEGRWNWTTHYDKLFFGIPYFNFTGWFTMMFYFAVFILIGRRIFEKRGEKTGTGTAYILVSVLCSLIVLVSPINTFLLYLQPIFPANTRGAEIAMLLAVTVISIIILMRFFRLKEPMTDKDRIIWLIPVILHGYDILAAYILGIKIAYLPSVLFSLPHLIWLWFIFRRGPVQGNQ